MNLGSLSRYLYKHPKLLFNYSLIISLGLHTIMLMQIPFIRLSSLPAQKGKTTIINVNLEKVRLHSETNIIKKKKEEPKEQEKELFREIVKKDEAIPYLKKEEKKKEPEKEKIEQEKSIAPPPSVSKNIIIKARETYEDKILKRINAMKHYPMYARRRGEEGVVEVKFTLNQDGTLKDKVIILKRCSYEALNDEAVKTIIRANPFPSFPGEIKKNEMAFVIDVDFRLEAW